LSKQETNQQKDELDVEFIDSDGNKYCSTKEQRFVRSAAPSEWLTVAEELKNAADLLLVHFHEGKTAGATHGTSKEFYNVVDKPTLSRPWFLLVAFALENAIKGALLTQRPELISGGKLHPPLGSHKLTELVKQLNDFPLSKNEERLLKIAEVAGPYWARYPIPKDKENLSAEIPSDFLMARAFERLFIRAENMIRATMEVGWIGPDGSPHTCNLTTSVNGKWVAWTPKPVPEE